MLQYECIYRTKDKTIRWNSQIGILSQTDSFIEMEMIGKGSLFHVIIGPQENGHFLCIPNWQIGCELAEYGDTFWNRERISHFLSPIDTETVVLGLSQIGKILEI